MKKLFHLLNSIFLVIIFNSSLSLNGQFSTSTYSPQFLYPEFTMSKISMKNGNSNNVLLNYNTLSGKMVFIKDSKMFDLTNYNMIDTIYIQEKKYIPIGNSFYQILFANKISLFVEYISSLIPAGTPAGYGGTSQVSNTKNLTSLGLSQGNSNANLPPDYIIKTDVVYWFKIDSIMSSFTNKKQLFKLFPKKQLEFQNLIKTQHLDFDIQSDLIEIAIYLNNTLE